MSHPSRIADLFRSDVTRDIPPVVYLYEQSPQKLADEVGEYIVTGGFPKGDPRRNRVKQGIHEQFVRLLSNIKRELDGRDTGSQPGACSLPASWISGFYGSGKSSFAKLLGMGLSGLELPDGQPLHEALLARDESPLAAEFRAAWNDLAGKLRAPVAVVFDIGAVARDNEQIHSAILRRTQLALGYCKTESQVADFELRLERDGHWDAFLAAAEAELGQPWPAVKDRQMAEEDFSQVLHAVFPQKYVGPMSWLDARAGQHGRGLSPDEAVQNIAEMLRLRAPDRDLVVVVDEVSQYIHQNEERMLRLQSFVSALGSRMKGRAWLFCTGQERLDAQNSPTILGKLKDRFPDKFRVHLAATNIRDVVHRRLLAKTPEGEAALKELFARHRSDLKLFAFGCEDITVDDFVEVYPMLPGHIDLLLQITSALRTRSSRIQGDDHAIRGLLQLLGELFRAQNLAELDVGELVTLDRIYDVQQTALDSDVQQTMGRVFAWCGQQDDALAERAAKAVALLELVAESHRPDGKLVAACLYHRVDAGDTVQAVTDALERLRAANLLGYSEKQGYKVQSSAGQEWERERQDIGVPVEALSEIVQDALGYLLKVKSRPTLQGRPFPWLAFFSDGKRAQDEVLVDPRDPAAVVLDLRFVDVKDDSKAAWIKRSDESALRDRILWVAGHTHDARAIARELGKSRRMVARWEPRRESMSAARRDLLSQEMTRRDDLESEVRRAVDSAWMGGRVYFRGRSLDPRDQGGAFGPALESIGERLLPELYPRFIPLNVTDTELAQLLETELSGPSVKFLSDGLQILTQDAGRFVPTCDGEAPRAVFEKIESEGGLSGAGLLAHFGRPPYGYHSSVVRACVLGLLRASRVRIRPDDGPEITSRQDPGTRDLFTKTRGLQRADVFPAGDTGVGTKDRARVCAFFEKHLGHSMDRENEAIADAVFELFPGQLQRLRRVEGQLNRLPGPPESPPALLALGKALEDCRRSRQVLPTVQGVLRHLDRLRDGLQQLGILNAELTDAAIDTVGTLNQAVITSLAQLRAIDGLSAEAADHAQRLEEQLRSPVPWRGADALKADADALWVEYRAARTHLIERQEERAERARLAVRGQPRFAELNDEQSHHVLRPITQAMIDTTPEATHPSLAGLRDGMQRRLDEALEGAIDRLDAILSVDDRPPVVKIQASLRNREVATEQELDALLTDLRDRVTAQLRAGRRVRLV